jgi:peroxiredoxin
VPLLRWPTRSHEPDPATDRARSRLADCDFAPNREAFILHGDQHKLRFPLLSDPGNRVARQFGLVYRVPDYQQAVYRRVFINLPFANGNESWELPVPATYILNRNGSVLFSSVNADYAERPEPAEILSQLAAD